MLKNKVKINEKEINKSSLSEPKDSGEITIKVVYPDGVDASGNKIRITNVNNKKEEYILDEEGKASIFNLKEGIITIEIGKDSRANPPSQFVEYKIDNIDEKIKELANIVYLANKSNQPKKEQEQLWENYFFLCLAKTAQRFTYISSIKEMNLQELFFLKLINADGENINNIIGSYTKNTPENILAIIKEKDYAKIACIAHTSVMDSRVMNLDAQKYASNYKLAVSEVETYLRDNYITNFGKIANKIKKKAKQLFQKAQKEKYYKYRFEYKKENLNGELTLILSGNNALPFWKKVITKKLVFIEVDDSLTKYLVNKARDLPYEELRVKYKEHIIGENDWKNMDSFDMFLTSDSPLKNGAEKLLDYLGDFNIYKSGILFTEESKWKNYINLENKFLPFSEVMDVEFDNIINNFGFLGGKGTLDLFPAYLVENFKSHDSDYMLIKTHEVDDKIIIFGLSKENAHYGRNKYNVVPDCFEELAQISKPDSETSYKIKFNVKENYNKVLLKKFEKMYGHNYVERYYIQLLDKESVYHKGKHKNKEGNIIDSKKNIKITNELDRRMEVVFKGDGSKEENSNYLGTFNYFGPDNKAAHTLFDVVPYWFWGNKSDDLSEFLTRIHPSITEYLEVIADQSYNERLLDVTTKAYKGG